MLTLDDHLAYRTARSQVMLYKGEFDQLELASPKREQQAALDCESYLQLGIDAFHWLCRADTAIRQAVYQDEATFDTEVQASLESLFRIWLAPSDFAERWIARQTAGGVEIGNLTEYRSCRDEVLAIIKHLDGEQTVNDEVVQLRDEALEEHRRGQTSEFV